MFEAVAFYLFAFLTLSAFFAVISTNNLLYALTALASGMIFISSFFFILGAEFLGVVQIAVYTGAVIVMYAFGLMFLDISQGIKEHYNGQMRICIMVLMIAFLLLALFAFPIYHQNVLLEKSTIIINEPNTFGIGRVLFSKYLIAFEITGVLLLVALIGGVALGLKDNLNALIHSNALAQIKENIEANLKSKSNSQDSAKKAKSTPKSTKIPKS
ncbi:hypothetical protein HMPREF2086_00898 [Helicobacter macacae MIT 99-5501]|uniref:NADH-quinone oxidoreductase subunit J n=1 Tax=Helicobacter macacae MIT 99-5501 TaxID=1357400 RepID=V8CAW2_9HELI|nr:NADH-quinone oxidoreductase subunit J [Helicobacter macacae]ETD24150.1 hypothetical protein HMPREF2086_00898 [Helicobacter macacae MIT 99-5501]